MAWLACKVLPTRQANRFYEMTEEAFEAWLGRWRRRPDQSLCLAQAEAIIKILRLEKRK